MPPVPPAKIGPYEVIELLGVGGMGEVYRSDDCVKVLDFGLAKALSDDSSPADPSASPTLSATRAGIVLGTPAYMSPEQARGRIVDRRTDIWSFGCVLFEMLTGKSAFTGETVTDTLAATGPHADDWVCYAARTATAGTPAWRGQFAQR